MILVTDDEVRYTLLTLEELFAAEDFDGVEEIVGALLARAVGVDVDIPYDEIDDDISRDLLTNVTVAVVLFLQQEHPEINLLGSILGNNIARQVSNDVLITSLAPQIDTILIREELTICTYQTWLSTLIEDAAN